MPEAAQFGRLHPLIMDLPTERQRPREIACGVSERAANEVLSLPIYPELTTTQLDEVIEGVRGFYGR